MLLSFQESSDRGLRAAPAHATPRLPTEVASGEGLRPLLCTSLILGLPATWVPREALGPAARTPPGQRSSCPGRSLREAAVADTEVTALGGGGGCQEPPTGRRDTQAPPIASPTPSVRSEAQGVEGRQASLPQGPRLRLD